MTGPAWGRDSRPSRRLFKIRRSDEKPRQSRRYGGGIAGALCNAAALGLFDFHKDIGLERPRQVLHLARGPVHPDLVYGLGLGQAEVERRQALGKIP